MRDTEIDKLLNGLLTSFYGRGVYLVELNMPVGIKKSPGLIPSRFIEIGIHSASLNDAAEVEIGLPVTYQVNFFGDQFYVILAAKITD